MKPESIRKLMQEQNMRLKIRQHLARGKSTDFFSGMPQTVKQLLLMAQMDREDEKPLLN